MAISLLPIFFILTGDQLENGISNAVQADINNPSIDSPLIYTLLEWSAASFAFFGAFVALFQFLYKRDFNVAIIGVLLFSISLFDGFHALATSRLVTANTDDQTFIYFSWSISRLAQPVAIVLSACIALWLIRNEDSNHSNRLQNINVLMLFTGGFLTTCFLVMWYSTQSSYLPAMQTENDYILKPFDILSLCFYLFAATLFWVWCNKSDHRIVFFFLLSLIPQISIELILILKTNEISPLPFYIIYLLKIFSYTIVLLGLAICFSSNTTMLSSKLKSLLTTKQNTVETLRENQTNNKNMLEIGRAKRPLGIQLPIVTFLLVMGVSLTVCLGFYYESKYLVVQSNSQKLKLRSRIITPSLDYFFSSASEEIIFLSRMSAVDGYVHAVSQKNIGETIIWRSRLENIFREALITKPHFLNISFVGTKDDGRELITIQKRRAGVYSLPASKFQQKTSQEYFRETSGLSPGEIYFSRAELQKSDGKPIEPYSPIIHVSTPIYDSNTGTLFGMIVIALDFNDLILNITGKISSDNQLYIANSEGDFLHHKNPKKSFAFEHGKTSRIQNEFPQLMHAIEKKLQEHTIIDFAKEEDVPLSAIYSYFPLKKYGSNHPIHLLLVADSQQWIDEISNYRNRAFLIGLSLSFLSFAVAILVSRRLVNPLEEMANSAQFYEYTGTINNLPIRSKNEIGVLARSFHNLLEKINSSLKIQKQSADKAHEAKAHLQSILDSAADAIITTDHHGNIISFNKAAERIFLHKESDLNDASFSSLLLEECKQDLALVYQQLDEMGEEESLRLEKEMLGCRADGTSFPFHLSISKLQTNTDTIFTSIIRDITEWKALEEERTEALLKAEESTKLKSEFLASMSHEIRTPMNGILGMLGLLKKSPLDDNQRHKLRLAQSSAESLLSLINDILDFSKIEAGKLDFEKIDFDLRAMLGDLAESLAPRVQEKGLEIILDLTHVNHSIVIGDPSRLRQILLNLIGNAIKFTDRGEIVVRAKLEEQHDNKLTLNCSVSDTGIGINEQKIGKIFGTFTQVDASTTRKFGGTGLGLAIVKQLCELMGGHISVKSTVGIGSTFSFSILLEKSNRSTLVRPNVDITGKSVIVVDDNAINREVLSDQLQIWGARVKEADNAFVALKAIEETFLDKEKPKFDIAFLDMQMPSMDGAELGKLIRAKARNNSMKLIMMTSMGASNDAEYFAKIGFDAYFPKPTTTEDLFTALQVLMENHQTLKEIQPILTSHHVKEINQNNNKISTTSHNILVAEDNLINQDVINDLIGDLGHKVKIANNGLEAIAILKESTAQEYALILMDCQMPELDGYESTRLIRNGAAGDIYKDIPIIALTANAMIGDKEKCFSAGMNDYMTKPIDFDVLESTLNTWLSKAEEKQNLTNKKKVWDLDSALNRVRGKENKLKMLVNVFLRDIPKQIADLQNRIEAGEFDEVNDLAKSVKKVALNLSADQLAETADQLAQAKSTENMESLGSKLANQNSSLIDELKKFADK